MLFCFCVCINIGYSFLDLNHIENVFFFSPLLSFQQYNVLFCAWFMIWGNTYFYLSLKYRLIRCVSCRLLSTLHITLFYSLFFNVIYNLFIFFSSCTRSCIDSNVDGGDTDACCKWVFVCLLLKNQLKENNKKRKWLFFTLQGIQRLLVTFSMMPVSIMHYNTLWKYITHYNALWIHLQCIICGCG